MLLESSKLGAIAGVRHGFSTRIGGASSGPFGTFHLGCGPDDDAPDVRENRRRFVRLLGLADPTTPIAELVQEHGATVRVIPEDSGTAGDALVTWAANTLVAVRTADCAPVLVACTDPSGQPVAVAAIHAGWRSAVAGIVAKVLTVLERGGARMRDLAVAIGPTIGRDAFEVGDEVIDAARASLDGDDPPMTQSRRGRPHLDLAGLVETQLLRLGVSPTAIERVGDCTFENRALYFSHRRDGRTGRHLSAIGFDATTNRPTVIAAPAVT